MGPLAHWKSGKLGYSFAQAGLAKLVRAAGAFTALKKIGKLRRSAGERHAVSGVRDGQACLSYRDHGLGRAAAKVAQTHLCSGGTGGVLCNVFCARRAREVQKGAQGLSVGPGRTHPWPVPPPLPVGPW